MEVRGCTEQAGGRRQGASRFVGGDGWCIFYPVSPGKCCSVTARSAETDSRTCDMRHHGVVNWNEEPPLAVDEVVAVTGQIRGKTLDNAARAGRAVRLVRHSPVKISAR